MPSAPMPLDAADAKAPFRRLSNTRLPGRDAYPPCGVWHLCPGTYARAESGTSARHQCPPESERFTGLSAFHIIEPHPRNIPS